MPTTKKRLNMTLSPELEEAIRLLAKRDKVSESAKAAQMLQRAIEIEEDIVLSYLAEERLKEDTGEYISHEELWKTLNIK